MTLKQMIRSLSRRTAFAGGAALLFLLATAGWAADAAGYAFQPNTPAPGQGVIRVTGVGLAPRAGGNRGQMRLMAERAAIVTGYRNLALALGQGTQVVADGSRYISASGYIQGAHIVQTRYYPDGRVEVDMTLAVQHTPSAPAIEPPPPPQPQAPEPAPKVETQKRQITEQEWLELHAQPKEHSPKPKEKP
ncbi:MAG: hypothetical protein FJ388_04765 [Verrucomicrobia bacterium]|nr:hypothetical protein [Verrucomicrobiota bacterium]